LRTRSADRQQAAAALISLTLISAGASGCRPAAIAPVPLKQVQLTVAQRQLLPHEITYQSTVTAIHEIPMSPEIDGRIVAMPMREGQIVKGGTLLYVLDQLPLESQAKADQAVAENARLNALRFVGANFSGAVSNKESADYVARAKQTQEIFRSKKALLAYKYVRAPIDGQLGAINNKLGDYVTAGTAVTKLVDNRRLWISIDIPAAMAHRLKLGQRVRVKAPGLPPSQGLALVTFIAPELDVQRQTLLVRATIDNPSGVLRHNQRVEASLELATGTQTTIPATATQVQAGQSFVFVAQPQGQGRYRLEQQPVRLGLPQSGRFPVLSGLKEGEMVVIGNLAELNNGATVTAGRPGP
jgi:membrane fusion protein, multidrug efflux system